MGPFRRILRKTSVHTHTHSYASDRIQAKPVIKTECAQRKRREGAGKEKEEREKDQSRHIESVLRSPLGTSGPAADFVSRRYHIATSRFILRSTPLNPPVVSGPCAQQKTSPSSSSSAIRIASLRFTIDIGDRRPDDDGGCDERTPNGSAEFCTIIITSWQTNRRTAQR